MVRPLHPEALRGMELFDRREYFAAHESLETAWRDERSPLRDLYRGILQVGVGYFHLQHGNLTGGLKMFTRARYWLDRFPPLVHGIDLAAFRRDFDEVELAARRLGMGHPELLEASLFKPIPRLK